MALTVSLVICCGPPRSEKGRLVLPGPPQHQLSLAQRLPSRAATVCLWLSLARGSWRTGLSLTRDHPEG